MANSSMNVPAGAAPTIFRTHRGRAALRGLMVAMGISILMMIASSALSPPPPPVEDDSLMPAPIARQAPQVVAAPVNPFELKTTKGPAVAAPQVGSGQNALYQSAISSASVAVQRYATYSYEQSPQEYVKAIPGLRSDAADALLKSSEKNWPEIEAEQVKASAGSRGAVPVMTSWDAEKGVAFVAVSVAQAVESRSGSHTFGRSYSTVLQLGADGGTWQIVSITGS